MLSRNPRTKSSVETLNQALYRAASDWNFAIPIPCMAIMDEFVIRIRKFRQYSLTLPQDAPQNEWLLWLEDVWRVVKKDFIDQYDSFFYLDAIGRGFSDAESQTDTVSGCTTPRSTAEVPAEEKTEEPRVKTQIVIPPIKLRSPQVQTQIAIPPIKPRPRQELYHIPVRFDTSTPDLQPCGQCGKPSNLVFPFNVCQECDLNAYACGQSDCNMVLAKGYICPIHAPYKQIPCKKNTTHGKLKDGLCPDCHPNAPANRCAAKNEHGEYFCTALVDPTLHGSVVYCTPHFMFKRSLSP
jgi:hypothetical protein